MDCPACKNPMIILELDRVETDYCQNCGGIWLDASELELLFEDQRQSRLFIDSFEQVKSSKEQSRPCPICLKKMHKIQVGGDEPVVIDRCANGHGLWFDKGELPRVLARGCLDKDRKVIKLLTEIFGKNKSEAKNGD
ncbi:MAG: zf-TFIIB domain-containing protein [Phycisphaerae bacterium]|jgi:hypothetical protein